MEVLKIIFFALIALFILVTFHEYGHYWVARKCGVRVLRFSIGFGKPLLKWRRGDTEFVLAGIPLGGYVKMFGESVDDEQVSAEERHLSFSHKTVWQRMAIVIAGPVANLLLATVIYFLVFLGGTRGVAPVIGEIEIESVAAQAGMQVNTEITSIDGRAVNSWADVFERLMQRMGETGAISVKTRVLSGTATEDHSLAIEEWLGDTDKPDFLDSLGIHPYTPEFAAIVGQVMPDSAADAAGLQVGDLIIETAELPIQDWEQWRNIVRESAEQRLNMLIEREDEVISLEMTPTAIDEDGITVGLAGVAPQIPEWPAEMMRDKHYGFFAAWSAAVEKTASGSLFILGSLKKLITGQVSTKSLGGPVSIAKFAGASADAGWQSFLSFLAIMSVMLGIMNLLPIPVLDGGHLLFYIIEAVKGSPLNDAIQGAAIRVGMSIVFGIMLLALYNDFARL